MASRLVILMLAACAGVLSAQGVATPEYQIPTIREPHHFVKLDNRFARVFDVTVHAYGGTLYHIHENPYFWISIGSASLRANTLGSSEIVHIDTYDGEVRYSPVVTHRVGNVGAAPFRNITVQIQGRDDVSPSGEYMATPKPTGYQPQAPLDNDLVRVERLILEPGQSTGRYTLPRSGILIAARDGLVVIERQGLPSMKMTMRAGDFDWHTGPLTHTITNVGPARFEAIEAVWK